MNREELFKLFQKDCIHSNISNKEMSDAMFSDLWVSGGEAGGSCWDEVDEDHHYPVTADPEDNFDSYYHALTHFL